MRCDLVYGHRLFLLLQIALAGACTDGGESETDERVAAGAQIVKERLCLTCHGPGLSGGATAYPGTQAFPDNLTPDERTGLGTWGDSEIMTAILDGTDVKGEPLCNAMPKFRDLGMTDEQARQVVAYLRSLASVEHDVPESVGCTVDRT